MSEVYATSYGAVRDNPEHIKKFIEYYVRTHDIEHVMIVGDCDKFPVRYIKAYNTEWGDKYYPSDLYYMDIYDDAGNFDYWDADGDDIIGEMNFAGGKNIANVNLDNINMYPDVSVARVPASTEAEVTTYVNKVLRYENASGSWFKRSLMIVDGGSSPFGSTKKMDAIASKLKQSGFPFKFYQDNPLFNKMTFDQRANVINAYINWGVGFVNYNGHANRNLWSGWYNEQKISGLTNNNEKLPIILSSACYPGRFHFDLNYYLDVNGKQWNGGGKNYPEPKAVQPSKYDTNGNESLAEHFLVKNTTGDIGFIGGASKMEHGAWLENTKGLFPYFYEEYVTGTRVLGQL